MLFRNRSRRVFTMPVYPLFQKKVKNYFVDIQPIVFWLKNQPGGTLRVNPNLLPNRNFPSRNALQDKAPGCTFDTSNPTKDIRSDSEEKPSPDPRKTRPSPKRNRKSRSNEKTKSRSRKTNVQIHEKPDQVLRKTESPDPTKKPHPDPEKPMSKNP